MKTLLLATALLVLLATVVCAQDTAPSPWFSEVSWCALKTVDNLASIGVGLSLNVYRFSPQRSAWLDGCQLYDGGQEVLGGFLGASTETKGIPGLQSVGGYMGLGVKLSRDEITGTAYLSTHF